MRQNKQKVVEIAGQKDSLLTKANTLRQLYEERKAIAAEVAVAEQELLPLLGKMTSEGVNHVTVGDYDVAVTTKITRKLDARKVATVDITEDVRKRVFPVTVKLSLRELNWLQENDNDTYRKVRATFKTASAKPSIKFTKEA